MEITEIKEQKEIISILGLEDAQLEKQVLTKIECSKAEWVQFLETSIKIPNFLRIWGIIDNHKIKNYLVAMNAVSPPISRAVIIFYQNFFGAGNEAHGYDPQKTYLWDILQEIELWGKELGARYVQIFTHVPKINAQYGFVKEKGVSMIKPIA